MRVDALLSYLVGVFFFALLILEFFFFKVLFANVGNKGKFLVVSLSDLILIRFERVYYLCFHVLIDEIFRKWLSAFLFVL